MRLGAIRWRLVAHHVPQIRTAPAGKIAGIAFEVARVLVRPAELPTIVSAKVVAAIAAHDAAVEAAAPDRLGLRSEQR